MANPLTAPIASMGNFLSSTADQTGFALSLLGRTLLYAPTIFSRRPLRALFRQMWVCGIASIPVTCIVSVFTGAILALNGGISLSKIGQEALMGGIVAVGMAREMGPFMTALILAASVGSAMAAELGTMKVSEEIDALEVMAIEPAKLLVLPRLLAMCIMGPVLTIYASLLGTVGGAITSYYQYGVSYQLFKSNALQELAFKDVYSGCLKAFIFAIVIAIVGCSQGLKANGGAIGVGKATRSAVVTSYLLIIILGYYITFLLYRLQW